MYLPLRMFSLVLTLGGCAAVGGDPCADQPDVCAWQAFQASPPGRAGDAAAAVRAVADPIVRNAMVTAWLAQNPVVSQADGATLCGLLATADARACTRRLTSAHLQR